MSAELQSITFPELSTEQVASFYSESLLSVSRINTIIAKSTINDEDKKNLKNNVEHLEALKNRIKRNSDASIWTTEDFSTHDAAIAAGKAKY